MEGDLPVQRGCLAGSSRHTLGQLAGSKRKSFAYTLAAEALVARGDVRGARQLAEGAGDMDAVEESICEAAADRGQYPAAIALFRSFGQPLLKAHAQQHIALAEARSGDSAAALRTIAGIDSTAAADVKVSAYAELAELQAKAGQTGDARATIELATTAAKDVPDFLAPLAQGSIAAAKVSVGDKRGAMALADAARDPSARDAILSTIGPAQAAAHDFSAALKTADSIADQGQRARTYALIAREQAASGDRAAAATSIHKAAELVIGVEPPHLRGIHTQTVTAAQAIVTDPVAALAWARRRKDVGVRVRAILGVVSELAESKATITSK